MTIFLFYKFLIVPGGAERLIFEEYKAFKELGYNVKLVVFGYKESALFGEKIHKDIISFNQKSWFLSIISFITLLKNTPHSVVISSSGIVETFFACTLAKTKYSLHLHHPLTMNLDTSKYSFFLKNKYQYILERSCESEKIEQRRKKIKFIEYFYISVRQFLLSLSIKFSENIFVLSGYAKDELESIYGVKSEIVQGAVLTSNPSCNPIPFIAKIEGLKILSVSRLEPQKRVDKAIYAFYEFLSDNPNSTMFIGGTGSNEAHLKLIVKDLGIETKVFFLGFIPDIDLLNYYSSVDVFLSLDWADYNITVYEAVSTDTKVVASNEGEFNRELINNGIIISVNPLDIDSIVNGIISASVYKMVNKKDYLSEILELYTWSSYCKNIAKILKIKPNR